MTEENNPPTQADDPVLISPEPLKEFCSRILQKVGLPEPDADLTADNLVFAWLKDIKFFLHFEPRFFAVTDLFISINSV